MLADSTVIRLEENLARTPAELEQLVAQEELAAAIIVPIPRSRLYRVATARISPK